MAEAVNSGPSKRLVAIGFAVVACLYVFLGYLNWWPGDVWGRPRGFELTRPTMTSGDEPHYLIIINSILEDGDIRIDNQFDEITRGGFQAGKAYVGSDLAGHSYLVNPRTGKHVTCVVRCEPKDYEALGEPRSELFQVPSHPAAYPAFMALAIAPFRPNAERVEVLVGIMSTLVSFAGVVLTFFAARRSGFAVWAAAAAAIVVGFASPWFVYLRAYFSDPSIGLFLLLAYVALRRDRPILAGLAIGVAMAMKSLFVVVAFAWIAERLWARRRRDAMLLTASVGASGVALLVVNMMTIRQPLAAGAMPVSAASGLGPLFMTLFDKEHGLFTFVPWSICAVVWGVYASRSGVAVREGLLTVDARRQLVVPVFSCLAVFAGVGSGGAGWCYGPRYFIPLIPFLALLAVDFAMAERRAARSLVVGLVAASAIIAIPSVPTYHWIFSKEPFDPLIHAVKTARSNAP